MEISKNFKLVVCFNLLLITVYSPTFYIEGTSIQTII
jgi:hypothetical protein